MAQSPGTQHVVVYLGKRLVERRGLDTLRSRLQMREPNQMNTAAIINEQLADYSVVVETPAYRSRELPLADALLVWSAAAHAAGGAYVPMELQKMCRDTSLTGGPYGTKQLRAWMEEAERRADFIPGQFAPRRGAVTEDGGLCWASSVLTEIRPCGGDYWVVTISEDHPSREAAARAAEAEIDRDYDEGRRWR